MKRIVLVTGANSGIGLALCERLLTTDSEIHLCLACRNTQRAMAARSALLHSHPEADISLLKVDVGDMNSVLEAAKEIKKRYSRLDYIYLNAGIMPNPQLNLKVFVKGLFSRKVVRMFATGEGLLTQEDHVNANGLQKVFATNVFGHFILIKELEPLLCCPSMTSQLIWTSSSNAHKSAFSLDDYQHSQGIESYSSSKYASDPAQLGLEQAIQQTGTVFICNMSRACNDKPYIWNPTIFFLDIDNANHVFCSKSTWGYQGDTPAFVQGLDRTFLTPGIRFFTNSFTLTPYNGAEALVWLYKQNPESLDPRAKYHSCTSGLGNNYVNPKKMDLREDTAEAFYKQLLELEHKLRQKVGVAEEAIK